MTISIEKDRLTAIGADGISMGYIVFPQVKCNLVNISQVSTVPKFRGQGVAEGMMEALLSHLTQKGQKAILTAPFAQQYLTSHPNWRHILPGEIHFTTH